MNGTPVLVATNVTNSNGEYVLNNILPGQCFVQLSPVVNNETYFFSPIVPANGEAPIHVFPNGTGPVTNITWNEVVKYLDVGMYKPVTIGDKVWEDSNGNGIQDAGELGKPDITVTLFNSANVTVATTITDAAGKYQFTNLPPSTYGVKFLLPPSFEFSPVFEVQFSPGEDVTVLDAVFNHIVLNNAGPAPREGNIPPQTLESGEVSTAFDAGIYKPVTVGGTVFDDKDGNGIQDVGEPVLAGAKITIINTLTMKQDTVISMSDGTYSLNSLMPGTYMAKIVPPSSDFVLSRLSDPTTPKGNDFDPMTFSTEQAVLLRSGESGLGSFDAGLFSPVTIENVVWEDKNANGIKDEGEGRYTVPMAVTLYEAGSTVPFMTTTTNAGGSFKFDDIPPGSYDIEFAKPAGGSSFTLKNVGTNENNDSDVDPVTGRAALTVVSGVDVTDITAGVTALPSIGPNVVFEDDDGDGKFDAGEKGLPNVLVTLYNSTNSKVAETFTDANGMYSFVGLPPGGYYISVNKDPDFKFSPVVVGGNQVGESNRSPTVTIALGKNDNTLIVGMYEPATSGNKVWDDLNGDGVQQKTEPGMKDVTVHLYNANGVSVDTTKTDVDGHYIFEDMLPGNYSVKFILPDRYVFTVQAKSSTIIVDPTTPDNSILYGDVTSDADRVTGLTPVKFIKSGEDHYSFDAGMFIPITVNGTTWHDLNADGIDGENESGLPGVKVTLHDKDGDVVGTTTSGPDGVWTFNDMPPGAYQVQITPPTAASGLVYMISPRPVNQTSVSDFNPTTLKSTSKFIEGGSSSKGFFDCGLYLPATIGDRIWFDDTPNGIQDGDEESFDVPMTIYLFDSLGYKIKETLSSDTGSYQFTGVKPGSYTLEFIIPDEDYKFTIPHAGAGNNTDLDSDVMPTTGRTSVITVTSGEILTNIDVGVMDFGPYFPDWNNGAQVCTNDGFDPAWMEIQEVNYLYDSKEACCRQHFWWRITQCMANEEFKFIKVQDKCESKIEFEDWEDTGHFGSTSWTESIIFDTVEECCANNFWFDYDGCVGRSPIQFKFEFCVDVKGLVDPQDCQSADIFANVIEGTLNEGAGNSTATSADTNITKVGSVSLSKVLGSTVCGGSLAGGSFINEKTGTVPDIAAAESNIVEICGVITVKEESCKDETCLREHYQEVKSKLTSYVNDGSFTTELNRRATTRLPPVPELFFVSGVSSTFEAQPPLLPATVTGDLEYTYFQGTALDTCDKKPTTAMKRHEVGYDKLSDCCATEFSWNQAVCCAKGGGCEDDTPVTVAAALTGSTNTAVNTTADEALSVVFPTRFYPTWEAGQLCGSKPLNQFQSWEVHFATRSECCEKYFNYADQLAVCMNAATTP